MELGKIVGRVSDSSEVSGSNRLAAVTDYSLSVAPFFSATYLAVASGADLHMNSFCMLIAAWLNAFQR